MSATPPGPEPSAEVLTPASPDSGPSTPAAGPTDTSPSRVAAQENGEAEGSVEVEPLPYDGVASVAVGTALWFAALVIMLPFAGDLRDDGRLWWVATAAVGFGLGLVGLWIVVRRRARIRAAAAAEAPAAPEAASAAPSDRDD
jgi:hypothetical protein